MTLDKLYSLVARVFFFGAFAALCLIVVEKIANIRGFTILRGYGGEKILALAGVLVIFVIAILLREIREVLRAKKV